MRRHLVASEVDLKQFFVRSVLTGRKPQHFGKSNPCQIGIDENRSAPEGDGLQSVSGGVSGRFRELRKKSTFSFCRVHFLHFPVRNTLGDPEREIWPIDWPTIRETLSDLLEVVR